MDKVSEAYKAIKENKIEKKDESLVIPPSYDIIKGLLPFDEEISLESNFEVTIPDLLIEEEEKLIRYEDIKNNFISPFEPQKNLDLISKCIVTNGDEIQIDFKKLENQNLEIISEIEYFKFKKKKNFYK